MSIQKAEMSIEQIENGQIVEHVAYPYVEYEHVTMENGMDIMSMIRDDVSTPTVTHNATSWKVGQGDSDVSESIVDSSVASMTIKGQTYQNILPNPSLRNSMTNGKTMQKLNEGYDSVNTVDGVCKSAILKGQTEGITDRFEQGSYSNWNGSAFSKSDSQTRIRTKDVYSHIGALTLSVNSGYQLFLRSVEIESGNEHTDGWIQSHTFVFNTERKFVVIISKVDGSNISVDEFSNIGFETNSTKMTELKSVKMPVLTTVGKNLFDGELETGGFDALTGEPNTSTDRVRSKNFIKVFNQLLTISRTISGGQLYIYEYDKNKTFIRLIDAGSPQQTAKNVQLSENAKYIKFADKSNNLTSLFQLEQGTQSTPYEPYKSNILTVNEPIELRGIGDAKDTLDCLTGEMTERIGEIVLDGGEDEVWTRNISLSNDNYSTSLFTLNVKGIKRELNNGLSKKCDKFPVNPDYSHSNDIEGIHQIIDNQIAIRVLKTKLSEDSAEGFNSWLSNNPLTVQYKLLTESVKTVDLSILDQDNQPTTQLNSFANGYIQVSSQGLIPSVDYEVPTSNSYHVDLMKPNTQYTMKNMQGTFTIDNIQYNASTNGTFTSPSALTNKFMITSVAQSQPMLLEGEVREKDIPYFKGIKSAFEDESKIEVLSTGKNLYSHGDSAFTPERDGWYFINGDRETLFGDKVHKDCGQGAWFYLEGGRYYFNVVGNDNVKTLQVVGEKERLYGSGATIPKGWYALRMRVQNANQEVSITNVMVEKDTETNYEPYKSNSTKIPLLSPLRSLPNGVRDEIVLDRVNHKAKIIQRMGEDLTQLDTPIVTEVNLEGYPYVYKGGHIFLNTEIAPTTEVTYSINQAHQIESSNEDILRHQNEINHLYQLIAQYVQVQYEAELIDIALQG